jgi:eukaryotic-like serine/threonine-protein kinase
MRADLRRYLDGARIMAEPVLAPPLDPGATSVIAPTQWGQETALVSGPVGYPPTDGYGEYDEYPYEPEEEQPKRSKWFLAALILLLLLLAGLLYLLASNLSGDDTPTEQVTVPNVVGKPVDQAKAELEQLDFEVTTSSENSQEPANQVISQDPPATTKADKGSRVKLTFSAGPEPVEVPNVVGQSQTDASRALTEAGFLVNAVPVEDPQVDEGLVISQDPPAGQQVAKGSQITINVSSGAGLVGVPDVSNQSEGTARSNLQRAGFTNIQSRQQASGDVAAGNVIATDPPAGTEIRPTDTVTLIVSSGAERTTVPQLQGLSEQNARTALQNAGLEGDFQPQPVQNQNQDGVVISTSPSQGQQVDRGSTVTVFIGDFQGGPTSTQP